ncbi:uncharacterized protein LOC110062653 isoform X2 [Orbicella faveolata]|nr:uncharacterized protein LOC110062653 isoform X2 [Orbicella faveolata]XP_020625259.1 uncharacterized protein LOC110062653 isoform X2 [Orbicella faveolata]
MSLKPVDGGTAGPKFPDIKGSKQGQPSRTYTLSWNPCTQFSDDKCDDVLLCQKDGAATYPVAKEASTFNEETDGSITLTYKPVTFSGYTRTAVVKLICDKDQNPGKPDPFIEVQGTGQLSQYKTTFRSKFVCDEGGSGLSTGSVLLIVYVLNVGRSVRPCRYGDTQEFGEHAVEESSFLSAFLKLNRPYQYTYLVLISVRLSITRWAHVKHEPVLV